MVENRSKQVFAGKLHPDAHHFAIVELNALKYGFGDVRITEVAVRKCTVHETGKGQVAFLEGTGGEDTFFVHTPGKSFLLKIPGFHFFSLDEQLRHREQFRR